MIQHQDVRAALVGIWFGRPIEPRPNWRQMNLPIGGGIVRDHPA